MIDRISQRLGLEPDWREQGTCRQATGVNFYPDKGRNDQLADARDTCLTSCPVLDACREWVMAYEYGIGREMRWGVWAGMTGRERYELERSLDAKAAA